MDVFPDHQPHLRGVLWPLLQVLKGGVWIEGRFQLSMPRGASSQAIYAEGLFLARLAIGTTTLASLIGIPLAWLSNRFDFVEEGVRRAGAGAHDPAALRGGDRVPDGLGQYGALNTLCTSARWTGWGGRCRRASSQRGLLAVSDHLPQHRGGAGQHRYAMDDGKNASACSASARSSAHHPAAHRPGALRRGHHPVARLGFTELGAP
ncbi:MAG: hypothetical protein U1F77_16555 [Kiritimatiellia bacterium]